MYNYFICENSVSSENFGLISYYKYLNGFILPVKENIPESRIRIYVTEFMHGLRRNIDVIKKINYIRYDLFSYIILEIDPIVMNHLYHRLKNDKLPLSIVLKEIYRKIKIERETKYVHKGKYVQYPQSFESIIKNKNWLQSGFAEFGWKFWTGFMSPDQFRYASEQAMYNACLFVNHGKCLKNIPSAKLFFKELKKIERKYNLHKDTKGS